MNIKQLDDLKGKKKDNPDDKKKRQTYVGGEKSGLAVEDDNDFVSKVVSKARSNNPDNKEREKPNPNAEKLIITLYSDGFVVSDDNSFRPYSDPQNQKFMKELGEGYVPQELQSKYAKGLEVALQDKRDTSYQSTVKQAPPSYFQGEGQSISGTPKDLPQKTVETKSLGDLAVPVIPGEPCHELQLKFPGGERRILQVNPSTPFFAVREAVQRALKTKNIKITTPFPIKDITGEVSTISQLDLLDSTVNVTLV